MTQGGNYWTLFTPGIWKDLHAVLHSEKLVNGTRQRLSTPIQRRQWDDAVFRTLVTPGSELRP
jgi:hypothetical protein